MLPQIVSITSQGQITIPASYRRKLGLEIMKKALIGLENQRIIIDPLPDFLTAKGFLATKKKISRFKTRKAFLDYLAQRKKK